MEKETGTEPNGVRKEFFITDPNGEVVYEGNGSFFNWRDLIPNEHRGSESYVITSFHSDESDSIFLENWRAHRVSDNFYATDIQQTSTLSAPILSRLVSFLARVNSDRR